VSVAFDDGDPVMTPVDGHVVPWVNALAKETDQAHVVVAGDTVRQTLVASDGDRENALIFDDGSVRVRLRVTVTSHRLPKPLVYELLFHRDSTT
jgi:acyl dehydratase